MNHKRPTDVSDEASVGLLDYEGLKAREKRASEKRSRTLRWLATPTIILISLAILGYLLIPSLNSPRIAVSQVKCASNLRQIGLAMLLYANAHGVPARNAADLYLSVGIVSEVFCCPETTLSPARGTNAEIAAKLLLPQHNSYLIIGSVSDSTGNLPLHIAAIELPGHHKSGGNVLLSDGHVEFLIATDVQRILDASKAGQPVPYPFTPPRSASTN